MRRNPSRYFRAPLERSVGSSCSVGISSGDAGTVSGTPVCWVPCYTVPLSILAGIVSIATLTVLAYECYVRVVRARAVSFPWAWRAVTYIWLYSLAWSGAPLLGWNRYILDIHGLGCAVDWKSKDANDASFVLFLLLGCLVAPVGVMAHCYGHILYSVRRVSWRLQMPLPQTMSRVEN